MNSVSTALPCFNESVFVAQLCPTVCDSMDCSLPGSSAHGILQARILEWVATSFSKRNLGTKELMFLTVVLEKTLESPLDCKEIQPFNPKGNQS